MRDDVLVILQVRLSSTRLPAKALLPINGVPLFILSALRAMNTGLSLIVATSNGPEDDLIVENCKKYNIPFERGPLNNVLIRFHQIIKTHKKVKYIVRLTADNIFPDGRLIDNVIGYLKYNKLSYTCTDSSMPYGLSVEVFKREVFEESLLVSKDSNDFEHVTFNIEKKYGSRTFSDKRFEKFGSLRCTIDTIEDYTHVAKSLMDIQSTVNIDSEELCHCLSQTINKNVFIKKLILGGAQIGSNYGRMNINKEKDFFDWFDILDMSFCHGIRSIDTAQGYPQSEEFISKAIAMDPKLQFDIFTKIMPLSLVPENQKIRDYINEKVNTTIEQLGQDRIRVLMFHRFDDMAENIQYLREIIHPQNIKLGVSVQNPNELAQSLKIADITHIQLPFNILDYRWMDSLQLIAENKERVNFHIRSVFLQGILLSPNPEQWPDVSTSYNKQEIINLLESTQMKFGFTNRESLLFSFVKSFEWIDGFVVGVDSKNQLLENKNSFLVNPMGLKQALLLWKQLESVVPLELLNPALWR